MKHRAVYLFVILASLALLVGLSSVAMAATDGGHGAVAAVDHAAEAAGEAAGGHGGHGGAHGDVQKELGMMLPLWSVIPFILILLSIAVIPLVKEEWWEANLNKGVVSVLCALPIFAYLISMGVIGQEVLVEVLHEYYAFIILLLALFTISGGIYLEGDLKATPLTNTVFIGIGALMASFIGTTGAAMLLIRPMLKTNKDRKKKTHIFVFFIFLVANIGGSLLPVGDPPLFMGYLYGVPFFWTLVHMWPMWLTEVAILLVVFYIWDTYAYSKEAKEDLQADTKHQKPLKVHGKINIVLILGVLLAVIFMKPYHLDSGLTIDLSWLQQPLMILLALVSFAIDYKAKEKFRKAGHPHKMTPRDHNEFTFHAIIEVAVLFVGIFVTMVPAMCLLKAHGSELGIDQPWQFFWMTGILSSFLDNAPTYATFFALSQGVTTGLQAADPGLAVVAANTGPVALKLLLAISLGAVFMGANTYIGNAPNFMVKSICEEAKVKMPSFFGYMAYSVAILIPTFFIIMAIYVL